MQKLKNEEINRLSKEDFKKAKKLPIIIILDDIRSLTNIGAVFRTCDAFLIEKIYLCGITATPPHRNIRKTALGATETVFWEYVDDITKLMERLQKNGIKIISVEQASGSKSLKIFTPEPHQKMAFVFGNEVYGVSSKVISKSDDIVEIPQLGTKHSLNVSISVGIVVWDILCKLHQRGFIRAIL